jgi:nucleobase:cation symporter-1, NCS1 family
MMAFASLGSNSKKFMAAQSRQAVRLTGILINLVDYYLVKRGRYDVASFFTPNGTYGRIQWWACLCYVITLAVQVPFLDQTFYVGPLVKPLGGADISWIVGFALASLLYLAGARRFAGARPGLPTAGPVGSAS